MEISSTELMMLCNTRGGRDTTSRRYSSYGDSTHRRDDSKTFGYHERNADATREQFHIDQTFLYGPDSFQPDRMGFIHRLSTIFPRSRYGVNVDGVYIYINCSVITEILFRKRSVSSGVDTSSLHCSYSCRCSNIPNTSLDNICRILRNIVGKHSRRKFWSIYLLVH